MMLASFTLFRAEEDGSFVITGWGVLVVFFILGLVIGISRD